MCLASMGNYLFKTEALVQEVVRDAANDQRAHDFGRTSSATCTSARRVYVYDFATNNVPGQEPKERGYWRDVGNIDVYYQRNMDLVEVDPIFNLYNDRWPIYTAAPHLPAGQVRLRRRGERARRARHRQPGLATGCIISGGHVHRACSQPEGAHQLVLRGERVASSSRTSPSAATCRIRRADHRQERRDPRGHDHRLRPAEDRRRFHVTAEGVVVIPKGMKVASGGT